MVYGSMTHHLALSLSARYSWVSGQFLHHYTFLIPKTNQGIKLQTTFLLFNRSDMALISVSIMPLSCYDVITRVGGKKVIEETHPHKLDRFIN